MQIEDVKRWHWMAIGALIGLALAYAWASMGSNLEGVRTADPRVFEGELVLKDAKSQQPFIKDIVIHPEEESFDGKVNIVTYKRLAMDKKGRYGWLEKRLIAKVPYKPALPGAVVADANTTIAKYLQGVASQNNNVRFSYGWWLEPRKAMMLGAICGLLVFGGVWPTLLNVMIGAGFGKKHDPNEKPSDKKMRKFDWGSLLRRSSSAPKTDAARPIASAGDQQALRDVADAYERNLGPGAQATTMSPIAQADGTVRKLEGGPVEPVKPMPKPGDDDEIEVKGEYYPVLIHHKKHHEDNPGEAKPGPSGPGSDQPIPPTRPQP